ncbi:hypothetical protein Tco_0555626 [Tanacetum coccineum]
MWNTFARVIKDAAKDSLGVTSKSSTHSTHWESWWFREEVQTKVAAKQARFKVLFACREGTQEDIDMATERIAKARERSRRDLGNVRYIKDQGGRTIVMEEDIRKRRG